MFGLDAFVHVSATGEKKCGASTSGGYSSARCTVPYAPTPRQPLPSCATHSRSRARYISAGRVGKSSFKLGREVRMEPQHRCECRAERDERPERAERAETSEHALGALRGP